MESLVGYASDEDNDHDEKYTNLKGDDGSSKDRTMDDNYDNVRMDMSEESNSSQSNTESSVGSWSRERRDGVDKPKSAGSREEAGKTSGAGEVRVTHQDHLVPNNKESKRDVRGGSKDHGSSSESSNRHNNHPKSRDERRPRQRDERKSSRRDSRLPDINVKTSRKPDDRHKRRSPNRRDRSRSRERRGDKRRRHDEKPRDKERHKSRDDKKSAEKTDDDRKKRKEHSQSPRPSSDKRSSRSPGRNSPADTSSRSKRSKRSPERYPRSRGGYDKKPSKLSILERLGIAIPNIGDLQGAVTPQQIVARSMAQQVQQVKSSTGIELPSYYNPAAMNPARYAEQIQKRRLLWGNKAQSETAAVKPAEAAAPLPAPGQTANKWEGTTFKSDQDGKMTAKFKRLMGIKEDASCSDGSHQPPEGSDILKKQEEMFNSMEMQYEVARVATHTHRGLGLGFGTFQYPR